MLSMTEGSGAAAVDGGQESAIIAGRILEMPASLTYASRSAQTRQAAAARIAPEYVVSEET
jgi:hypothetical protein